VGLPNQGSTFKRDTRGFSKVREIDSLAREKEQFKISSMPEKKLILSTAMV
jgi:hypothetical protein